MIAQLKQQRLRIMVMISLTFLLTPLFSLWATVFFGLMTWNEVRQVLQFGLLPTFLTGMLALVATYFWRFLYPLSTRMHENPGHPDLAVILHRRIRRFNLVYWGLFIVNAACMSLILLYSMNKTGLLYDGSFIWNFLILQLTVSILVGMPAYLLSQDKLSQLIQFTGLLDTVVARCK